MMLSRTAFEADLKTSYLPLTKRLTKVENQIQRLIIRAMANAKLSTTYWNSIRRELDVLYAKMNGIFRSWAIDEIPGGYKRSAKLIHKRIDAMKTVLNKAGKTSAQLLHGNASMQIMRGLYSTSVDSFLSASVAGRQNLRNLFIRTQQKLVEESLINVAVGTGFEMGNLQEAQSLLSSIFRSPEWNIVTEKRFIQAGRYKYKPSYYAQMVARTKFHQGQSQAALVQAANYDTDLIQISAHNTTTQLCMDFEGKIFSVSGKDKRFPLLTESPPFHPNCLHLMFPTFEGAMVVQGTLESFSAFSRGEISRPPIPSGFIPAASRVA